MNNPAMTRIAIYGLLILLSLFVLFHFTILLGIVPYEMVWGGRLKRHDQMLTFETFSILANLLMLAIVGLRAGFLRLRVPALVLKTALWIMFVLFLLNTAGNALSTNDLEKLLFTPVTLLLAFFSLILALSKEQKPFWG